MERDVYFEASIKGGYEIGDDYLALLELEGEAYLEAVIDKVFEGKARFFKFEDLPLEQQKEHLEKTRQWIEGRLLSEYDKDRYMYQDTKHQQHLAIHERLHQKAGRLLDGVAYLSDLSRIETSSGPPHPKAGPIAAFLRAHAAELQEIDRLRTERDNFMSFEAWKAKQEQPYVDGDKQLYDNLVKHEAGVRQREAG